jgi:hypothetical protein
MRLSLPLVICAAMWAAAAQAKMTAQVTAQVTTPVTISLIAPVPRAPAVMKNSMPAATVADERSVPSAGASPTEETPAGAQHRRKGLKVRFDEANTTHDGRLTPQQAQASWPAIAKHFSEIDKDHRGYVTVDDIRLYRREHRRHNGMPDQGMPGAGSSIGGKAGGGEPDTEQ